MERKILFLDSLNCRPRFKCGTEGLIGASILGATGLGSGIFGSASASSNNRAALAFNKWSQLQAQDYNTKMYERQLLDQESMYNKYQSPQAIAAQLQKAGINPSALAAGHGFSGGSMPSVPSVGSSPALSAPTLENTGTPIGQGLQAAAGAIADLSHANEADANAKATSEKLSHEVNLLLARQRAEKAVAANTELQTTLTQKYGDKKWSAEIGHLASLAYANWAQGDLNSAEANYKDVLRQLANFQLDMDNETRTYLIGKIAESYNLLKAQVETEKTVPSLNRSSASNQRAQGKLANEQALTVKELRGWQVGFQQARTELAQCDSFVERNTLWQKCEARLAELRSKEMLPDQVEQAIIHAKKENDWYEVNELLGVVDTGCKVAGTYYGAKTGQGFVSAQDTRNEIQAQYNQHLYDKDQQDYKARRSAVAGSGHYWGQDF